ncbi:hypothetical protein FHW73_000300 [Luteimonas sp. RC10]|nr:hypothetical protein [Luteimonas sp. RC10]MBB3342449.1 hypothetical protein [Luteimonas sp. RC10]
MRPSTNTEVKAGFNSSPDNVAAWGQQGAESEVSSMTATGTTVVLGKTRRRA